MDISTLQSPQIDALAKAMMAVQSELSPVTRDAQNSYIGSKYATLTAVVENCRDALERNGIWLSAGDLKLHQICTKFAPRMKYAFKNIFHQQCKFGDFSRGSS